MAQPLYVIKAGGRVIEKNMTSIVADITDIARNEKAKIVFVHGGGDLVTKYSEKLGVEPRFVTSPSGIRSRYTSREELEVYLMVMAGLLNKSIVAMIESKGVPAIGLTGADGGVVMGERKKRIIVVDERGRRRVIEGGYTGKITRVDGDLLLRLFELFDVVVISPVILGNEGELLNVDGDQIASRIAATLNAETLVVLSDVDGVIIDNSLVTKVTMEEARALAEKVGVGMNRKLLMAADCVDKGVGSVVICNGLYDKPVYKCLDGIGTVISK